jgi:hypothetical protein
LAYGIGAALLLGVVAGRRDDLLSFRLAIAAAFALSPIVWGHYWALLLVPLALRHPRLSPAWFAACWIPTDSLFWSRYGAFWIGIALVAAAVQLGLPRVPPLGLLRRRQLVAAGAVAITAVSAVAAGAEGALRGATLRPQVGPGFALAQLRIDAPSRRLCWIMWSEGLGPASGAVITRTGTRSTVTLPGFEIGPGGTARGCSHNEDGAHLADIARHSSAYRLVLATAGATSGRLRG